MTQLPIRPSPTLSSIASCTTRTASPSRARACAKPPPGAPDLTPKPLREPIKPPTGADCPPSLGMVPAIVRNAARDQSESLPAIIGIRRVLGDLEVNDLSAVRLSTINAYRSRQVAVATTNMSI